MIKRSWRYWEISKITFGFRGVVLKNFWQKVKMTGGHIGFLMNMKTTQNQFVHLKDHAYQISCKSNTFEKSPIMTAWQPSWKFYINRSNVKSLRTPLCADILGFVKIRLFLRKFYKFGIMPILQYMTSQQSFWMS